MDDLEWQVEREVPHLRRFAYALTGRREEADDLVQDALERAWRKRHLRRGGVLRPWLFKILYRVFLNGRRKKKMPVVEWDEGDMGAPHQAVPPAQDMRLRMDDMGRALDALPEEQRAVVVLVALEGVSYDQAAQMLGIPVNTLRSRLFRGREKLRELMDGTEEMKPRLRRVK
ncbi:RNA polymerase sigma factor [Tepidicaulis sp. LMO-SS28]|uniref:RNA polymerase sigma factor n=1 Tax=Tepidicaulis sp. LMO-SS28 TaxID=3447455 RepID=UPI003EE0EF24